MIRIPHVYIPNLLLRFQNKRVNRLVVVHPRTVQYVQHDPDSTELCIRYITGEEICISGKETPENTKKMFDNLVYQIKDVSD